MTTGAALRATAVVAAASSGVLAVVADAADKTRHAEARRAKPSQASKSREGLTNNFGEVPSQQHIFQKMALLPWSDRCVTQVCT